VNKIGLYQKIIDEAVNHTPLEAEFAKQLDKLNDKLIVQEAMIKTLVNVLGNKRVQKINI
jgi:hypothetical protein